ncbi:hypothetical protein R3P38DRAFT_3173661 [Favolaschia claudopus]|uniref:Uncharacterized protein n=1 Tax=Favolaschia claudopus TaxID=2862362 RepID=A0AAW0DC81_9AGAR
MGKKRTISRPQPIVPPTQITTADFLTGSGSSSSQPTKKRSKKSKAASQQADKPKQQTRKRSARQPGRLQQPENSAAGPIVTHAEQNHHNTSTLPLLEASAKTAVACLHGRKTYPPDAQVKIQHATSKKRRELEKLGSSHTSFAVLKILFDSLPRNFLTKGSLTCIRSGILQKDSIKHIAHNHHNIPLSTGNAALERGSRPEEFYQIIGAIAEDGGAQAVKVFLEELLGPVIAAVCTAASSCSPLREDDQDSAAPDAGAAQEILDVIYQRQQGQIQSQLAQDGNPSKRRLSPGGKENLHPILLAIQTTPESKRRRKSDVGTDSPLAAVLVNSDKTTKLPKLKLDDEAQSSSRGLPDQERQDGIPLPHVQGLPQVLGDNKAADDANETVEQPKESELEQDDDAASPPSIEQTIQLGLILFTLRFDFFPEFPFLPSETWRLIRQRLDDMEPFETFGDAALRVVLTSILLARLQNEKDGGKIFNRIISPLLSNSTFLHLLQSMVCYTASDDPKKLPKFPGNAFEIVSGAWVFHHTIEAMQGWILVIFEGLIESAIADYRKAVEPAPQEAPIEAQTVENLKRKAFDTIAITPTDEENPSKRRKREDMAFEVSEIVPIPVGWTPPQLPRITDANANRQSVFPAATRAAGPSSDTFDFTPPDDLASVRGVTTELEEGEIPQAITAIRPFNFPPEWYPAWLEADSSHDH